MKHIVLIISLFLSGCATNAIVSDLQGIKKVPVNKEVSDKPFLTTDTKE